MAIGRFLENFILKFFKDETTTLAASLAFYTALSLAPLLILFVTISSQLSPQLQQDFLTQVHSVVGADAAVAIEMVMAGAKTRPDLTSMASLLGISTLLLSASLIFGQLQTALNRIFEVKAREIQNLSYFKIGWQMIKERLLHIGLALSFILTVIVSLLISSLISASSDRHEMLTPWLINLVVSSLFYILMFTFTFRYLPDRRQPWRRAIRGGLLTAFLFVLGKELIGIYLGSSAIGSAYGAAGSVIVLLVWVYYSTLITFIGAQVSAILMPIKRRKVV